ncbi:hypothetical protein PISMIDRAFT_27153 [Pisolithus microcarpus 441]|uniref:RRM domain-containing protein n=1 Tax=Pisolithus microcarpus 441 TaxID=765257 RepID=A0A0C9ZT39_9AGAM|nr:hypothetical protein PISMIDRAFT_27153 [Pisolithus microcarpus 441]
MSSDPSPTRPRPAKKRKLPPTEEVASDDDESSSSSGSETDEPNDDAHVLSHAERRRQKKRELKAAKTIEAPHKKRKVDDSSATRTKAAATGEPKLKRENSVWVGNLSYKTTRDGLKRFFDGIGEITRIHMPKKPVTGENLGFAYVDFATSDAKVTAITLSEGHLDGRKLLIKDGNDFTGRPAKNPDGNDTHGTKSAQTGHSKTAQKILLNQKQPPAPSLFLGNLGFDVTEDSIRELFESHPSSKHGASAKEKSKDEDTDGVECEGNETGIRKIRMGTFEDSGKCKGFAFVDFTSIEQATNALTNPRNHRLKGRDLVVEYASPDAVRRGGGGPKLSKPERQGKRDKNHSKDELKAESSTMKRDKRLVKPGHRDDTTTTATISEDKTELTTVSREFRKRGSDDRAHKRRAKPGAALAQAVRQSAAIVPSQGQKIMF